MPPKAGRGLGSLPQAKFHIDANEHAVTDKPPKAMCGRGGLSVDTLVDAAKVPAHRRCMSARCRAVWREIP